MNRTRIIRRRGMITKKKLAFGKNEWLFLTVLSAFLLGLFAGAIKLNLSLPAEVQAFSRQIEGYFSNSSNIYPNNVDIIFVSVIKHGTTLSIIWVLAFLPPASIVSLPLVFIKGMGGGFTTALLIKVYGLRGILYAAAVYLPQNLLLVPAYLFAGYAGLHFTMVQVQRNRANREKLNLRRADKLNFSDLFFPPANIEKNAAGDYIGVLLLLGFLTAAAALTETYITPYLIGMIM